MHKKITKYSLDTIKIGQKKDFVITINEQMIEQFAKLSGDYNPLHVDDEYAKKTDFKHRICHGMLLASFFSQLVGMYLPGENALYLSQTLKFQSPCFINDTITVQGKVVNKSISTKIITIKTSIINLRGDLLVDGQAKVMVRDD